MDDLNKSTRRRAVLAGGATLAFGGGVAYFATRSESRGDYVPAMAHASEETTGFGIELAGRPIAGEPDAPVDLYYWTDYLCPFCARFETETFPKLGRNYLDAGEVRLVALAYPNIGSYSTPAMVWDRCVWRQVAESTPTAYWRWHKRAFDAQAESGTEWADDEAFRDVTDATADVDTTAVQSCRDEQGEPIRAALDVDANRATAAEIRGTPGFVIYNRDRDVAGRLVGAHPYENFEQAIEQVRQA